MIGLSYVALTALLMLGGVLGQEKVATVVVLLMVLALAVWAVRSRTPS